MIIIIMDNIKCYDLLHKMEAHKNYFITTDQQTNDLELAQFIHNEYHKFDHNDLKQCLMKCITEKEMKRIILNYELRNYTIESKDKMNLQEFANKSQQIFDRYQSKAGGFYIEDDWILHTYESQDYDIKKHEILFENSIENHYVEDADTEDFLFHIERLLNSLANNIKVEVRYKEDKKLKITWILVWASDKSIKKKSPKISL